jgi:hypothetical protein
VRATARIVPIVPLLPLLMLASCRCDAPAALRVDGGESPQTSGTSDTAAASSAKSDDASKAEILDAGREPRSPLTFAFVPGRREARVLAMDSLLELHGTTRMSDRIELRFEVTYPAADSVALLLRHAETTAPDVSNIASTVGAVVRQELGKAATAEPPEVTFPAGADGTAAQYVKGAVVQGAAAFLPSLPSAPLGEGARWRFGGEDGARCDLVSRRDGRVVLERTAEIHGVRRLDVGKPVMVDEDQRMRIEIPLDGIARHVEATLVNEKAGGTKRTTHLRFEVVDRP